MTFSTIARAVRASVRRETISGREYGVRTGSPSTERRKSSRVGRVATARVSSSPSASHWSTAMRRISFRSDMPCPSWETNRRRSCGTCTSRKYPTAPRQASTSRRWKASFGSCRRPPRASVTRGATVEDGGGRPGQHPRRSQASASGLLRVEYTANLAEPSEGLSVHGDTRPHAGGLIPRTLCAQSWSGPRSGLDRRKRGGRPRVEPAPSSRRCASTSRPARPAGA